MPFSIRHRQKKGDVAEEIVIGLVELLGIDANNNKVVLHIKIYRTAPKEFDGLSKSLYELAIEDVFKGDCTELEHSYFYVYLVNSKMGNDNIDPAKFVSEMTIRLSNKIHELIDELSEKS